MDLLSSEIILSWVKDDYMFVMITFTLKEMVTKFIYSIFYVINLKLYFFFKKIDRLPTFKVTEPEIYIKLSKNYSTL